MPKLSCYNQRSRVIKALERCGFVRDQGAKHLTMYRPDDESRYTTIPNENEIRAGTLRTIIRQCGLSSDEFIRAYGKA